MIGCEDDCVILKICSDWLRRWSKMFVRIHFKKFLSVIFILESWIVSTTGLPVVLGKMEWMSNSLPRTDDSCRRYALTAANCSIISLHQLQPQFQGRVETNYTAESTACVWETYSAGVAPLYCVVRGTMVLETGVLCFEQECTSNHWV